ncbi:hypothetical protein NQ317_016421 [Molorchus minor]|uniref:Gustatory receptor n=1 Tax=Molorchus minor TaxID=1323400 RepID=A0ABQ9JXX4_9CUCU|nr:hypothetical protein NQ317_016421 [Molorchus minor]
MYLTYSRKSIRFLVPILKFSNVLALAPWYNFEKKTVASAKLFKLYAVMIALLTTTWSTYCLTVRLNVRKEIILLNYFLNSMVEITGLVTFLVTVLGSAFWNMDAWHKLIANLSFLEDRNNLNTSNSTDKSVFKNANSIFLMGTFYYIALYIFQYLSSDMPASLSSLVFFFYADFVATNIAYNIVLSITLKYKDLVSMLTDARGCSKNIRKVKQLYLKIDEVIEYFNNIFGLTILGIFAHLFSEALVGMSFTNYNYSHSLILIMMSCMYMLITVFCPVVLTFSCQAAFSESRNILMTCYKLEHDISPISWEAEELARLKYILVNRPPVFLAAGFFELDKRTNLGLLNTITTYFIVVAQYMSQSLS